MPQLDSSDYLKTIRTDYRFIDQSDYVLYTIQLRIDPCRDLVEAGGAGDGCCFDTNVAGCQTYDSIAAGPDMQVAFFQNAHITNCQGTEFAGDPNCGTFLEVKVPVFLNVVDFAT